jgi:hypothetical protein
MRGCVNRCRFDPSDPLSQLLKFFKTLGKYLYTTMKGTKTI